MEPFQCFSHFKCPTELEKQETATVLEINRPNNQNNSKSKRGRKKKKKTNLKSLPCSDRHLSDGRLCQPTFQSSYSSEGKTHTLPPTRLPSSSGSICFALHPGLENHAMISIFCSISHAPSGQNCTTKQWPSLHILSLMSGPAEDQDAKLHSDVQSPKPAT